MTKISNLYSLTNYITANSSGSISIAPSTSGYTFDVSGSSRFTGQLSGSNATFTNAVTASAFIPTGSAIPTNGMYLPAANTLAFATSGTVDMTLSSAGNVGIGTTNPSNLLHLYGTDGNSYLRWTSDVATTGTRIGYNGTEFRIDQQQNADVTIRTNSSERMRITSGGNVGIGTSSPNAYSNLTTLTVNGTNGSVIDLTTGGTLYGELYSLVNELRVDAVGASSRLGLFTNSVERMRITSGGNVGIGVTPSAWTSGWTVLQVGTSALQNVGAFSQLSNNIFYDGTNYKFITSNGASRIGLNTDGEVFIGTVGSGTAGGNATIVTRLSIAGATGIATFSDEIRAGSWIATANSRGFTIRNAANTAYRTAVQMNSSNVLIFGQDSDITALTLGVGSEAMRITSAGNVGIGTTSPNISSYGTALTLLASSGYGGIEVYGNGSTNGGQIDFGSGSTRYASISGEYESATNGFLNIRTLRAGTITNAMRITSAGNVGIGTTAPTGTYGKLSVAGGISILDDNNAKLEIGRYSSGAPNSYIKLGANSNSLRITNNTDVADVFIINNNSSLIQNGVNVRLTKTGGTSITFTLSLGSIGAWTPGYATIRVSGTRGGLQEHYAAMYFLKLVYFQSSNVTTVNNVSGDTGSASIGVTTAFTSGNTIMTITISDVGASTDYMIADFDGSFQTGVGSIT